MTFILSNCGDYLTKLILNDNCGSSIMSTVKEHCQNLEEFEFNFRYINEDDFIDAFTKMKKLKCLIVKTDLSSNLKKETPADMTKILSSLHDNVIEILLLTNKKTIGANKCFHNLPQVSFIIFNIKINTSNNDINKRNLLFYLPVIGKV